MRTTIIFAYLVLFANCHQRDRQVIKENSVDSIELYVPLQQINFGSKRDLHAYNYKKKLSDLLSLNPLENGTDSFELRFWKVGSLTDPVILYIIKKQFNKSWSNLHYQLYRGDSWNSEDPQIDSLAVEMVFPRTMTWEKYITSLNLDSLWFTPSQREVVDDKFGGLDGYSYFIELANTKRYRFLNYYVPDRLQDVEPNHRRVINFQKSLREGIMYNGIVNP